MIEEMDHVLMDQGKPFNESLEAFKLRYIRQAAVKQQVGDFNKGAVVRQFLDIVATIAENTFIAVKISDRAGTGPGIFVSAVKGYIA